MSHFLAVSRQPFLAESGQNRTVQVGSSPKQHQTSAITSQLNQKLACIFAQDHLLFQHSQTFGAITLGNSSKETVNGFLSDESQQFAHFFFRDAVIAENTALVQNADRISDPAIGLQRNETKRLRRSGNSGITGNVRQMIR